MLLKAEYFQRKISMLMQCADNDTDMDDPERTLMLESSTPILIKDQFKKIKRN